MGRFIIFTIFVLISFKSYSTPPCGEEYIKVVRTDTCRYVQMGVKTYADYYMHKKRLLEIKEIIPSIKDSLESIKISHREVKENMDSIIVYNKVMTKTLESDRDAWRDISYDLEEALIDKEYELYNEKKKRKFRFGGGALSSLLIFLLL